MRYQMEHFSNWIVHVFGSIAMHTHSTSNIIENLYTEMRVGLMWYSATVKVYNILLNHNFMLSVYTVPN